MWPFPNLCLEVLILEIAWNTYLLPWIFASLFPDSHENYPSSVDKFSSYPLQDNCLDVISFDYNHFYAFPRLYLVSLIGLQTHSGIPDWIWDKFHSLIITFTIHLSGWAIGSYFSNLVPEPPHISNSKPFLNEASAHCTYYTKHSKNLRGKANMEFVKIVQVKLVIIFCCPDLM